MVNLDRENMAEDIRKRFDNLLDYEQLAIAAFMEVGDYSIEEALDIVESGDYEFYPGVDSMADLAYEFIHEYGMFGLNPDTLEKIGPYIDYEKLGSDLSVDGYCKTSYGIVLLW